MFLISLFIIIFMMHYVCIAWTCFNTSFLAFNTFAKVLPFLLTILFAAAFILPHQVQNNFTYILQAVAHMWLGVLFIYFIIVMAVMAIQLPFKLFGHPIMFKPGPLVIIAVFIITAIGIYNAFKQPQINEITIETNMPGTDGIKIVQISDSHLGETVTTARAAKLTKQVNDIMPDIIVFTGDIFEDTGNYTPLYVQSIKDMNARLGKFGVTGNHEYYNGVNYNMDLYRQAGILPLQNKAVKAGKINIIGVNDIMSAHISPEHFKEILELTVNKKDFNLLLSHTPLYLDEAAENNINLMLSGHTHNGQIWPFKYFTMLKFKNINGLYKKDNTDLYVTSGTFYWGPALRIKTINELPVITLKEVNQ